MTTLDDEIALVRRALGEGWGLQPNRDYGAVLSQRGVPLSAAFLPCTSYVWRALVDLARKLEAATGGPPMIDDADGSLARQAAKSLRPGSVTFAPEPTAAEPPFQDVGLPMLDEHGPETRITGGYAVISDDGTKTVFGEMATVGEFEPTAAELLERVAVELDKHPSGAWPKSEGLARIIRAALAGRTP